MIKGHEYLGDVRPVDLIAKLAQVNFNSVIRVLIALRGMGNIYNVKVEDIVPASYAVEHAKQPSAANADACEDAFDAFVDHPDGDKILDQIDVYKKGAGYNAT